MRPVALALVAAALLAPAVARAQTPTVRYEITGRTTLLATPAARAKVVTQIDSGVVIDIQDAEEMRPAYSRVTYNGQQGWIPNTMIHRVVIIRDTTPFRLADTVRVTKVDTVVRVDTVRLERQKSKWETP